MCGLAFLSEPTMTQISFPHLSRFRIYSSSLIGEMFIGIEKALFVTYYGDETLAQKREISAVNARRIVSNPDMAWKLQGSVTK
jgi:hypothetical protein